MRFFSYEKAFNDSSNPTKGRMNNLRPPEESSKHGDEDENKMFVGARHGAALWFCSVRRDFCSGLWVLARILALVGENLVPLFPSFFRSFKS